MPARTGQRRRNPARQRIRGEIGGEAAGEGNVVSGNTQFAIHLIDSTNSFVQGNFVGLDQSGLAALPNAGPGIRIEGGNGILVGGDQPGMGNVVAASGGSGIWVFHDDAGVGSSGDTIVGNIVGTDATGPSGDATFGNSGNGIMIDGLSTNITVAANIAGNNRGSGVYISGGSGYVVRDNFLGTDAAGSVFMPNFGDGATLNGDAVSFTGNVASGNKGNGITISGNLNYVAANKIGLAADGKTAVGNLGDGILIFGNQNTITQNTIAYNGMPAVDPVNNAGSGVGVFLGKLNAIEQNSIFSNTTLGIDLNDNNLITPIEDMGGTPDFKSNDDQMFPVITSVTNIQGSVTVSGTLDSPANPNTTFVIDFYSTNPGAGECFRALGRADVAAFSDGGNRCFGSRGLQRHAHAAVRSGRAHGHRDVARRGQP